MSITRRELLKITSVLAGAALHPAVPSWAQRAPLFASHRGYSIAYEVVGTGPAVVLQHGLLANRGTWTRNGFTDVLADAYRVILVDSLGHGDSDKPDDPPAYRRELRAGDIAAVLDDVGIERAHYVGYSMGGWIGTGMALHQADRLLSLALGGWDPVGGIETVNKTLPAPATYESLIAGARAAAPELVAWITPEVEPALRACWDAAGEVEGSRQAIADLRVPVFLWDGIDDPYHDPAEALAGELENTSFLSVPGDHLTASVVHGVEAARGLRAFLDSVPS